MNGKHDRVRRLKLAAKIREARKERGLTQKQLGELAGSDYNYVYELEKGKKSPTVDTLCRFADALEMPVRDLIDF